MKRLLLLIFLVIPSIALAVDTATVTISCPLCSGDSVQVTRTGTATYTDDYTDTQGATNPFTISTFPTTITITPVDDATESEGTETVIYTLGTCTGCSASGSATVYITDNDTPVTETDYPVIGGVLPSPTTVPYLWNGDGVEVTFGLSNVTDATPDITCKYRGSSGWDWADGNAFTTETKTSGGNHTSTFTYSPGAAYTYYAKCQDANGYESPEQQIQFYVEPQASCLTAWPYTLWDDGLSLEFECSSGCTTSKYYIGTTEPDWATEGTTTTAIGIEPYVTGFSLGGNKLWAACYDGEWASAYVSVQYTRLPAHLQRVVITNGSIIN